MTVLSVGREVEILQVVLGREVREPSIHTELERQRQRAVALSEAITPSARIDIRGGTRINE